MPKKAKAAGSDLVGAARFGRAKGTLKMGLVGLPNVGKSSLFNLLTEQSAAAENYPFWAVVVSAATLEGIPELRQCILDAAFDKSSFPSFGSNQPNTYINKKFSDRRARTIGISCR
jgi:obg-like ATPase 1